MRWWSRQGVAGLALVALVACVPVEDDSDGGLTHRDTSAPDATLDGNTDTGVWPPALQPETEQHEVGEDEGTAAFFDGELLIDYPAGTFADGDSLRVTRDIVDLGDEERVGYTFGDHGYPIDPSATVRLRVPRDWVPPGGADSNTLGLYHVDLDAGVLGDPLAPVNPPSVGPDILFTAELSRLDPFVIAAP